MVYGTRKMSHSPLPICRFMMCQERGAEKTILEYNEDFNSVAHKREMKRKIFYHQSQQFPYREYLVNYLKRICMERAFSKSCLYLAVYFLDLYMDYHQINIRRLVLVAIASITMAAAVEENCTSVPKLVDIIPIGDVETLQYFRELEGMMLNFFDWDLLVPTPAHYIPYFMRNMITDDELRRSTISDILHCMFLVMETYQDTLLYDVHLLQYYSPSKIAAALVAACRMNFGLPLWNENLRKISQYEPVDFQEILEKILNGTKLFDCINCYEHYHYM